MLRSGYDCVFTIIYSHSFANVSTNGRVATAMSGCMARLSGIIQNAWGILA